MGSEKKRWRWLSGTVDQRTFDPEASLLSDQMAVCGFRLRVGQSSGPGAGEKQNCFTNKHFVPIISGDKTVLLITCEAKKWNLEGLCPDLSWVNGWGVCEPHLGYVGRDGLCRELFRGAQCIGSS